MPSHTAPPRNRLISPERLRIGLQILRDAGTQGIFRQALARQLGKVSTRTIDRLLHQLELDGAELRRERVGSQVRIVLLRPPAWDEHVSAPVRLALQLASVALSQSGTLLWEPYLKALVQWTDGHMTPREQRLFETLCRSIQVQGGEVDAIEPPDILEPLLQALEDHRTIRLTYTPVRTEASRTYTVVPYRLTHDLFSGGTFLLVWDLERRIPRHFRLNRIETIEPLGRRDPYPDLTMDQAARYQIGGWASGDPPFEVSVRIRGAHWLQAFKEAPPTLPDFETLPGGTSDTLCIRFKANHLNGVTRWLLQFGPDAEVLSPEDLRKAMAELTQRAAARYESPNTPSSRS